MISKLDAPKTLMFVVLHVHVVYVCPVLCVGHGRAILIDILPRCGDVVNGSGESTGIDSADGGADDGPVRTDVGVDVDAGSVGIVFPSSSSRVDAPL
jgi:hypothetical protein